MMMVVRMDPIRKLLLLRPHISSKYSSSIFLFALLVDLWSDQVLADQSVYTLSTATKYFNQTVCSCLLSTYSTYSADQLACPSGYKFNIVNVLLFDAVAPTMCAFTSDKIIYKSEPLIIFLQSYCTDSTCNISGSLIQTFVDPSTNMTCPSAEVIWNCYKPIGSYSISTQFSQSYGFTYFFYVIILVMSSTCIVIGSLFIMRRFFNSQRGNGPHGRAYAATHRTRYHRGFSPSSATRGYHHSQSSAFPGDSSQSQVWTTSGVAATYAPPLYDHIDESSSPINPPPSYNAALVYNYQKVSKATTAPPPPPTSASPSLPLPLQQQLRVRESGQGAGGEAFGNDSIKKENENESATMPVEREAIRSMRDDPTHVADSLMCVSNPMFTMDEGDARQPVNSNEATSIPSSTTTTSTSTSSRSESDVSVSIST